MPEIVGSPAAMLLEKEVPDQQAREGADDHRAREHLIAKVPQDTPESSVISKRFAVYHGCMPDRGHSEHRSQHDTDDQSGQRNHTFDVWR